MSQIFQHDIRTFCANFEQILKVEWLSFYGAKYSFDKSMQTHV